jgi:hypothetical protein
MSPSSSSSLPLRIIGCEDFAARVRRKSLPADIAAVADPLVTLLEALEVQLFTVVQTVDVERSEPIIA